MATQKPTQKPTQNKRPDGRPVLVTTKHRGVFFGYLVGEVTQEKVVLNSARNIVYWDVATRGFGGLASTGPTKGCRVGPAMGDNSTIFDITGCFGCTEEATRRFEDAPWST